MPSKWLLYRSRQTSKRSRRSCNKPETRQQGESGSREPPRTDRRRPVRPVSVFPVHGEDAVGQFEPTLEQKDCQSSKKKSTQLPAPASMKVTKREFTIDHFCGVPFAGIADRATELATGKFLTKPGRGGQYSNLVTTTRPKW
jgi:hypothetical protein